MKKLIVLAAIGLSTQANLERIDELVGIYEGKNCSFEIRDLSEKYPLGYSITFPEWKYQLILTLKNKVKMETIVSDLGGYETEIESNNKVVNVFFEKGDEWITSTYNFNMHLGGKQGLKEVNLFKDTTWFPLKGSCKIK